MTTQFIGIKEFRMNISALCKKNEKTPVQYIVTRNGRPVLKVEPIEKDIAFETLAAKIARARADAKAGRVYTTEQVLERLQKK